MITLLTAMNGVFKMIAVEEQNIRTNIAARTSPLLLLFSQCKTKSSIFFSQTPSQNAKITVLIHCEDQRNIIASVTNYIAVINGNIIYLDQHVDADENVFL
jgi:hypothetical protein